MPLSLYMEIKHKINTEQGVVVSKESIREFIDELPLKLQSHLQLEIHKDLFSRCELFAQDKFPKAFYAWIGTVLRHESVRKDAVIYREGD